MHVPSPTSPRSARVGVLARMRVGTKLTLLVLIPTCGLLVFASLAAVDHWRKAAACASSARHARRDAGEQVRYEQRHVCSDGSVRRIEWSARFMPEERIVHGVGRDVTDRRHAAEEQAALRRVATLVAKGVPTASGWAPSS